ncbi:MAG: phosphoribosylformylglycinamidine synthase subunit PurS [Thermoanaerobaculia bacterium]|nr:phosphoribosylformylglycinamidine synthase subunit PurS [Thermoanaerobaculia bacterium]
MKAIVTVFPRREILDPQGKAIAGALARVGFTAVTRVRAGKVFEIELGETDPARAREQLEAMCRKLLANTVVEDFTYELVEGAGS